MVQRLLMKLKMWKRNSYPTLPCLGCSQEAVQTKKEGLNIKLMAEREVVLFRQQLLALRQALARAHADNVKMCRRQENQVSELRSPPPPSLWTRSGQETRHWAACGSHQSAAVWSWADGTAGERRPGPQLPFSLLCSPETRGSGQKAFVVIHIWLKMVKYCSYLRLISLSVFLWVFFLPREHLGVWVSASNTFLSCSKHVFYECGPAISIMPQAESLGSFPGDPH